MKTVIEIIKDHDKALEARKQRINKANSRRRWLHDVELLMEFEDRAYEKGWLVSQDEIDREYDRLGL